MDINGLNWSVLVVVLIEPSPVAKHRMRRYIIASAAFLPRDEAAARSWIRAELSKRMSSPEVDAIPIHKLAAFASPYS